MLNTSLSWCLYVADIAGHPEEQVAATYSLNQCHDKLPLGMNCCSNGAAVLCSDLPTLASSAGDW